MARDPNKYSLRIDGQWRTDLTITYSPTKEEYDGLAKLAREKNISVRELLGALTLDAVREELKLIQSNQEVKNNS
jgi:hypothetical protein